MKSKDYLNRHCEPQRGEAIPGDCFALRARNDLNLYAVILAGGVGSRFWPFSRELEPKQFLKIIKDKSLLQDTVGRLKGIVNPGNIYIISNKVYFFEIKGISGVLGYRMRILF